jgi:hypothetical protein
MTRVGRFLNLLRENIREDGAYGVVSTGRECVNHIDESIRVALHQRRATNVYDREWDVLVLLDCATIEMMTEVSDEYAFLGEVGEHITPGTCSNEWMERTFTEDYREEMQETVHVTANTSSEAYLNSRDFRRLDEVWRDGWDEDLGTIPARTVTDRAIHHLREHDPERAIVHYMQPHLPFVGSDIESNVVTPMGVKGEGKMLGELHEEGYSRGELWDASVENLRYVLDDLETLLTNVDAERVVISADHGQSFGEQGYWSHPCTTYIDVLKRVPWCVTSATDAGEYEPEYDPTTETTDSQVSLDEKLAALGYK